MSKNCRYLLFVRMGKGYRWLLPRCCGIVFIRAGTKKLMWFRTSVTSRKEIGRGHIWKAVLHARSRLSSRGSKQCLIRPGRCMTTRYFWRCKHCPQCCCDNFQVFVQHLFARLHCSQCSCKCVRCIAGPQSKSCLIVPLFRLYQHMLI